MQLNDEDFHKFLTGFVTVTEPIKIHSRNFEGGVMHLKDFISFSLKLLPLSSL